MHCNDLISPVPLFSREEMLSRPSPIPKSPGVYAWYVFDITFQGKAEGSTLNLTLGCLLANQLGIQLRRVGGGKRMRFGPGETALSEWMARNAFVAFHVCEMQWELESQLLQSVSLPLSLDENRKQAFHAARSETKAAKLPVRPLRKYSALNAIVKPLPNNSTGRFCDIPAAG
jgi:hypothetical protein